MPAVLLSLNSSPPTFLKRWFQYPNNLVHILFDAYHLVTGILLYMLAFSSLLCCLQIWLFSVH